MNCEAMRSAVATLSVSQESHYFSLLLSWCVSYFFPQTGLVLLTKIHMAHSGRCSPEFRSVDALLQIRLEGVLVGHWSFTALLFLDSPPPWSHAVHKADWTPLGTRHRRCWEVSSEEEEGGASLLKRFIICLLETIIEWIGYDGYFSFDRSLPHTITFPLYRELFPYLP